MESLLTHNNFNIKNISLTIFLSFFFISCIVDNYNDDEIKLLLFDENGLVDSPTGFIGMYTENYILLNWDDNSDILFYSIFISRDGNRYELLTTKIIDSSYEIYDLNSGTGDYYFYLIAHDKFGNESQPSKIILVTVP